MVTKTIGLFAYSCVLASFVVINSENSFADGSAMSGASIFAGASTVQQPLSQSTLSRQARRLSGKPILPAPKNSSFSGKWYMALVKKADTCPGGSVPNSLNVGLNIDKNLNGTDLYDRSPFFKGKTSGNTITFGRQRTNNFHLERQGIQLKVKGNSGVAALRSEVSGPALNCYTLFQGAAVRR